MDDKTRIAVLEAEIKRLNLVIKRSCLQDENGKFVDSFGEPVPLSAEDHSKIGAQS